MPEERRVARPSPVAAFKAVKNAAELKAMRAAHVRDGAAVCRAFSELGRRGGAGATAARGAQQGLNLTLPLHNG